MPIFQAPPPGYYITGKKDVWYLEHGDDRWGPFDSAQEASDAAWDDWAGTVHVAISGDVDRADKALRAYGIAIGLLEA